MQFEKLLPYLQFLRLVDENGKLSLTNLATIAAIVNLLFCQKVGYEQVSMFIASLISYQFKKYVTGQPATDAEEMAALKEQVSKLQTSVTAVQLGNKMTGR